MLPTLAQFLPALVKAPFELVFAGVKSVFKREQLKNVSLKKWMSLQMIQKYLHENPFASKKPFFSI